MYLNNRAFEFWMTLINNSCRAEAERDLASFLIYYKAIITFIRELGVNDEICSRLWDSVITIGNDMFSDEKVNCSK